MSDSTLDGRLSYSGPDTVPGDPSGSAGALIRAARERQDLDMAALAAMLKIPLRKLEALELDRHEELPGPTFERALAQAACRALKIDPRPVLALLPRLGANTLEQVNGGLNTPFRERQVYAALGDATRRLRPIVLLPLVLLVGALALFLLPPGIGWHVGRAASGAASGAAVASAWPPDAAPQAAADVPGTTSTSISTSTSTSDPAPAPGVAPEPRSAEAAVTPAPAPSVETPTPPAAPVVVQAQGGDSWVEVIDGQGHPLLSRTLMAGESVTLDAGLPLRVKIGNASATRISLRGENVDLSGWTHDNVARLELK